MRGAWLALLLLCVPGCGAEDAIQHLISQLGDATFARRQAAQEKLLQLGEKDYDALINACVRAYAQSADPEVKSRLRELMRAAMGKRESGGGGFLGIMMSLTTAPGHNGAEGHAVGINMVNPGTPAEQAGLLAGDQLLKIDDMELDQPDSVQAVTKYVRSRKPGTAVKLTLLHEGAARTVDVKLGERPAELQESTKQSLDDLFDEWLRDRLEKLNTAR